jgi:arsenite methyltransferase
MTDYLKYQFTDDEDFVNTFDEAPLWSASFGLLLLKHLDLRPGSTLVDLGSGAGFPLMELAGRMGGSCKLFGVDPWLNANKRAAHKIRNYGYGNVELITASAEKLPFASASVDMVISNLGINNFENPHLVFAESYRVLKPGGKLTLTTNLNGHWKEFYAVCYETLQQMGKEHLVPLLRADEEHRGTTERVAALFVESGFRINKQVTDHFEMKFVDGSAFLNHHFVKVGWLITWLTLFPKDELGQIFSAIEQNLNEHAAAKGGLTLSVPMLYMEGVK